MRKLFSLPDVARRIAGGVPGGTAPTSVTSDRAASSRAGARQGHELPSRRRSAECGQRSPRNLATLLLATVAFAIGSVPAFAGQFHFTRSRVDGLATSLSAGKSKQHILDDISDGVDPRVRPARRAQEVATPAIDFQKVLAPLVESPTNLASRKTPPEIAIFARKAEAAWDALQGRFASRVSEAEIDHLLACFVFGLTSPSCAEGEPSAHLDICRALLALRLPPERVHAALHEVPEPTERWIENAYQSVEQQGKKIGRALTEHNRNREDFAAAEGDTGVSGKNEGTEL
jgi:hypothetical protein